MLHEFLIDKNDYDAFLPFIPEMYLSDLKESKLYGVATFDRQIDADHIVGVTLIRIRYQWQEIVWVALSDNYPQMEYGADLIKGRVEDARNRGFLFGSYSEFPTKEIVRREYFSCAGFSHEIIPSHTFSIYTSAFARGICTLSSEEEKNCCTLKDLTPSSRAQIAEASANSTIPIALESPIDWSAYDWDASVCYLKNGTVYNAILISRNYDFYSIEGMLGDNTANIITLFEYLRKIAPTNLNKRPLLVVPTITEVSEKLLENAPLAKRDELSLMCFGYENIKKRKTPTQKSLNRYYKMSPEFLLGIENMDVCPHIETIDYCADNTGLPEYFDAETREKNAVYERYWNKLETRCLKDNYPLIIFLLQHLATDGYSMYLDGKAKPTKLSELGFTKRPLSTTDERRRMATQLAGLILTEQIIHQDLDENPEESSLSNNIVSLLNKAKFTIDTEIADTLKEVLTFFFAATGKNIYTGEKIPSQKLVETVTKSRVSMVELNNLTQNYESFITEKMIELTENDDVFKIKLNNKIKECKLHNEESVQKNFEAVKKTPGYKANKLKFENALTHFKELLNRKDSVLAKIDTLCETDFFSKRRAHIEELYFSELRIINYYIESVDAYLYYLYADEPLNAMNGIYIREKLDSDVVCPNPNISFDKQITKLDSRFAQLSKDDYEKATVFLAWENAHVKNNQTNNHDKNTSLPSLDSDSIDECEKALAALEQKAKEHSKLLHELILTDMFSLLPELVELFNEASIMRNAASELLDAGFDRLDERYDIYQRATALYDTFFNRARHIVVASRMTMKELMSLHQDYHSTEYKYCLEKNIKMTEEGLR